MSGEATGTAGAGHSQEAEPKKRSVNQSLEFLLSRAVDPYLEEDERPEFITKFCQQVKDELEGPQIATRLLAHRVQSPHDAEALNALVVLETCVLNCGQRFHNEINKFKFLNELIKILSPKYLGDQTPDRVKRRAIELLYSWKQSMRHLTKLSDAYQMLKSQGIIGEDPTYMDTVYDAPVVDAPVKMASFEDEEKSKLLNALLSSKNPEDLQAANRLIKSMVRAEDIRLEKKSKQNSDLAAASDSAALLADIVHNFDANSSNGQDIELMKELCTSLVELRRSLFKHASEAAEGDEHALAEVLLVNDEVNSVIEQYKLKVEPHLNKFVSAARAEPQSTSRQSDSAKAQDLLSLLSFDSTNANSLAAFAASRSSATASSSSSGQADDVKLLVGEVAAPPLTTCSSDAISQLMSARPSQPATAVASRHAGKQPNSLDMLTDSLIRQNLPSGTQSHGEIMREIEEAGMYAAFSTKTAECVVEKKRPVEPTHDPFKDLLVTFMRQAKPMREYDSTGQPQPSAVSLPPSIAPSTERQNSLSLLSDELPVPQPDFSMNNVTARAVPASLLDADIVEEVVPPPEPAAAPPPSSNPNILDGLSLQLSDVEPSDRAPLVLTEANNVRVQLLFADNRLHDRCLATVVNATSTSKKPLTKFCFELNPPDDEDNEDAQSARLLEPSGAQLPAFSPIAAQQFISHILLFDTRFARDSKIALSFTVSYTMGKSERHLTSDCVDIPLSS